VVVERAMDERSVHALRPKREAINLSTTEPARAGRRSQRYRGSSQRGRIRAPGE
jgi:hypothetical protein